MFVATAVQGRFVEDLFKLSIRAMQWTENNARVRESALRESAAAAAASAPAAIAVLILFAGAIAEGLAVVALCHQHADAITGTYVLIGAIFLTVTAVIAPAVAAV